MVCGVFCIYPDMGVRGVRCIYPDMGVRCEVCSVYILIWG